jgi:DNA invertase Pin-like site-specific DNA recombinase
VETEHRSGKTLKGRPILNNVLTRLDNLGPDGVLVVTKLDRLARSVPNVLFIVERAQRRGWAIVILDMPGDGGMLDATTATGRLQLTMLAAFAAFERELISQRTREGLAIVKASGKALGKKSTVPATVRTRIVEARSGGTSWKDITDALNADSTPTPAGKAGALWHPTAVRRIYELTTKEAV